MEMNKVSGRLIGGLIVIALGALLLLDSLDVLDFNVWEVVSWIASIGMIVFGLGMLIAQRFQRVFLPIALMLGGGFILLGNLGYDATRYWPVILIIVGLGLLFGHRRKRRSANVDKSSKTSVEVSSVSRTINEDDVHISCTLGEAKERVESQNFRGGTVNVTMGNVGLDLRDTVVVNRPATLEVNMTMGGLVVRVPTDWVVNMENVITMGEAEDKRTRVATDSGEPHLVVSGRVTMSSITIDD